jgi:hypothetical protein
MVVAELPLVTIAAWAQTDRIETQTEVEPIPLADIGLAGKEADIDNSSYPLGNYEGSAGYYVPSAQEQLEALLCHPAVRGEPSVLGQLDLKIVVRADHQALQTRPMRLLNLGAGSAERFAVLTASAESAAEAVALVVCLLNWLHDLLLDWLYNLLSWGCLQNRLLLYWINNRLRWQKRGSNLILGQPIHNLPTMLWMLSH